MSLPRVAVVGSCVSRDPFNRIFVPSYKSRAELVSSVYQTALPSLVRETEIEAGISKNISPNHSRFIQQEFSGQNLDRLVSSKPDVLVVDFYADVHFGVTTVDRQYVTRNHMAFTALKAADEYFRDEGNIFPERGRFDGYNDSRDSYCHLAKSSIEMFIKRIKENIPETLIVLNSARFANSYTSSDDSEIMFPKIDRLNQKNKYWEELDNIFAETTNCERLVYPSILLKGSESNPWGLNPVHYGHEYYDYFWKEMARVASL